MFIGDFVHNGMYAGLSRLVQSELLRAAAGQQQLHSCITGE